MAKEPDQTKWVGIRPTDPAENIPVTESAPISEIDVNPAAGCDNFPVTESVPLTDILVAPSAGAPVFNTLTQKKAPAIGDLTTIEEFIRIYDDDDDVGAPNYNQDAYEVPADKMFYLNMVVAWCKQADPTEIEFMIRKGIVNYLFYSDAYGGALERHIWTNPIYLDEGEIVRVRWSGTLATSDVVVLVFGHIISKY